MASRRTRLTVTVFVAVVVVVLAVVWVPRLVRTAKSHFTADVCTVQGYDLDPDQAAVASTMIGSVTDFRSPLPFRASVLVLMAGLQESKLRNLAPGDGDRDSVGVLQQRPSQGWGGGKAAALTDVGEATREFLAALVKVQDWQTMAPADAIQAVQISADGSAYAQHESEATALATALQGRRAADITCSFDAPTKVAAATTVAQQVGKQLGITTPVARGRTVTVPGAHWQTAAWFVANSDRLGIDQVDYAGRTWKRSKGWKTSSAGSAAVVATMHELKK
ncbi:hypothetical protein [uncultured Jatrophihabitans sp.]|uniref:hypothetical protein n=1 Tax=uncultured Jatrophihabitans sp. TaxID=1610747 RepID=UPI0035C999C5